MKLAFEQGAEDLKGAIEAAIAKANAAVVALAHGSGEMEDLPASTIIAAVVSQAPEGVTATIGWLGDSRAYFISDKAAKQLTKDHSWLVEIVEAGKLTYAEAIRCRGASAITKTLGGFPAEEGEERDKPSIVTERLAECGWLLLCTDGLWNYARSAEDFANLVRTTAKETNDPLALSRALVQWAREQGGKDNITVAALPVAPE